MVYTLYLAASRLAAMFLALLIDTSYSPVKPPATRAMFFIVIVFKDSGISEFGCWISDFFTGIYGLMDFTMNRGIHLFEAQVLNSKLNPTSKIRNFPLCLTQKNWLTTQMSKFGAYLKTKQFRFNLLMAIGSLVLVILIIFF